MKSALLLTLMLAGSVVALAPTASADSCASVILENQVCGPVFIVYCTVMGPFEGATVKDILLCDVYNAKRTLTVEEPWIVLP